jgi:hypothetical protein
LYRSRIGKRVRPEEEVRTDEKGKKDTTIEEKRERVKRLTFRSYNELKQTDAWNKPAVINATAF